MGLTLFTLYNLWTIVNPGAEQPDEFVPVATFLFPDEAEVVRGLLRSSGILCYLENEHTLAKVWPWTFIVGGLRLMVPASLAADLREALATSVQLDEIPPDIDAEPVETLSGATSSVFSRRRAGMWTRLVLAVAIFCAPSLETLRILYVWR